MGALEDLIDTAGDAEAIERGAYLRAKTWVRGELQNLTSIRSLNSDSAPAQATRKFEFPPGAYVFDRDVADHLMRDTQGSFVQLREIPPPAPPKAEMEDQDRRSKASFAKLIKDIEDEREAFAKTQRERFGGVQAYLVNGKRHEGVMRLWGYEPAPWPDVTRMFAPIAGFTLPEPYPPVADVADNEEPKYV